MNAKHRKPWDEAGLGVGLVITLIVLWLSKGIAEYRWSWAALLSVLTFFILAGMFWVLPARRWKRLGVPLFVVLALLAAGLVAIAVVLFGACSRDRCDELDLVVTPTPAQVAVGSSSVLAVTVDGEVPPGEWRCKWYVDNTLEREGRCDDPPSYAASRAVNPDTPGDTKTLTVLVEMRDSDGHRRGSPKAHIEAISPELVMLVPATRAHAGDEIVLEIVYRDGGSLDADAYMCDWKQPELPDRSCVLRFEIPVDPIRKDYDFLAEAQVLTADKVRVGPVVSQKIHVLHADRTALIVLDSSNRMGDGLLEAAIEDIGAWIDAIAARPGTPVYVGVQVFGENLPDTDICLNTRPLVELYEETPDPAELRTRLQGLRPGTEDAPLIPAFDAAISDLDLANHGDGERFYLLTITGGPDTCGGGSLADVLYEQRILFQSSAPADELLFEFRLMGITVVVPFNFEAESVEELVVTVQETVLTERVSEIPAVILAALDRQTLREIIRAGLDLSVSESALDACRTLLEVALAQQELLRSEEGEEVDNGAAYLEEVCADQG